MGGRSLAAGNLGLHKNDKPRALKVSQNCQALAQVSNTKHSLKTLQTLSSSLTRMTSNLASKKKQFQNKTF